MVGRGSSRSLSCPPCCGGCGPCGATFTDRAPCFRMLYARDPRCKCRHRRAGAVFRACLPSFDRRGRPRRAMSKVARLGSRRHRLHTSGGVLFDAAVGPPARLRRRIHVSHFGPRRTFSSARVEDARRAAARGGATAPGRPAAVRALTVAKPRGSTAPGGESRAKGAKNAVGAAAAEGFEALAGVTVRESLEAHGGPQTLCITRRGTLPKIAPAVTLRMRDGLDARLTRRRRSRRMARRVRPRPPRPLRDRAPR